MNRDGTTALQPGRQQSESPSPKKNELKNSKSIDTKLQALVVMAVLFAITLE